MRQTIKRLAGGSGESSALRWRQGCCCSSLLIRPCRCIKPNAQASRDPLTIRLPHLQTTHSFRDRTLHYLQPPLVPDCSPQTATRWHSSLTALKNPRPRLLSALSALQVALLSCKVLESPSSRQAGFRRQNPVSIHPARHVEAGAHRMYEEKSIAHHQQSPDTYRSASTNALPESRSASFRRPTKTTSRPKRSRLRSK